MSMLCLVLQEYGLMMDAEIGIYAIRAQAMLLYATFIFPATAEICAVFEAPVCNKPI